MTNHFNDISYYRNLDPLILYGDSWLYGAALPVSNISVPKNVFVLHERNYNIISWKNSAETDMKGYYIYRSKSIGHNDITLIAIVLDKDVDGKTQTCYVDYLLDEEIDTQYYYAIVALNNANFPSLLSQWTTDVLIENSYSQIKYLYTDQLTQSYWSIIDLYKQLGNIDTDRNIVPYRDRGYVYTQQMVPSEYPSLYLQGQVAIETGFLNPNDNIQQGYVITTDSETALVPKNIATKVNCNYLYVTTLNSIESKTYELYMDTVKISSNKSGKTIAATAYENDTNNNLRNVHVDKFTFSTKVDGTGVYDFYWNSIYNYWQYENGEVNLNEFGITFEGEPQEHNVISVDFSIIGFVYFRVPYIYNSKILQTYITEKDSTVKFNEINFKTYNHLIFASTLGKVFNSIQIDLKESKGNLYVNEVSDPFIYKNFGSYFDFKQPAWMGNQNYRNCVLGNQESDVKGLWQAAMNGGTQLGLRQAVSALSDGDATFSSMIDVDYYTSYSKYFDVSGDLPEIKLYDPTISNSTDDIVLYNDSFYLVNQDATISVDMFSSVDSTDVSILTCVNNIYKDVLFRKSYDETDSLVVTNLTDTGTNTFSKYDLVNISDHYYEVRDEFTAFYKLIAVTDTAPETITLTNGDFYFNTHDANLYKLVNGAWELDSADLVSDAIYSDSSTGKLYQYDGETLVGQNSLRNVDDVCSILKFGVIPLDLDAIYKLEGIEYYLIDLRTPITEKDYIFKDIYTTDSVTDPISYSRQYLLNTYEIRFDSWKKSVNKEKYLVYGNKIKLNNQNIIYPSASFKVYEDENLTQEISSALYTVNTKDGTLTWNFLDNKPNDGTYIWINYIVDIRSDIKKLIELIKFPQVNIKYVWKDE